MKRWIRVAAASSLLTLGALGLVACGGGDDNSTTAASAPTNTAPGGAAGALGTGHAIHISTPTGSSLAYNEKTASAVEGPLTIDFDNMQAQQHDVALEDSSGKIVGQTDLVSSDTVSDTIEVQAGTYTFFCTVPGHREAGMEGTLTVK